MKMFLMLFVSVQFLIASTFAAPVPAVNVDNIGGYTTASYPASVLPHGSTLINLMSSSPGTNLIFTFQKASGLVQEPFRTSAAGKYFHAIGAYIVQSGANANDYLTFAQSTSAPTNGGSTGSPPAGSVYFNAAGSISSAANIQTGMAFQAQTAVSSVENFYPLQGVCVGDASARYYFWYAIDGSNGQKTGIRLMGYEDSVPCP